MNSRRTRFNGAPTLYEFAFKIRSVKLDLNSGRARVNAYTNASPTYHRFALPYRLGVEKNRQLLAQTLSVINSLGGNTIGKLNRWVVLKSNKIKELWRARSLLYRRGFLRPKAHFSAFFAIFKIQNPLHRSRLKSSQNFTETFSKI